MKSFLVFITALGMMFAGSVNATVGIEIHRDLQVIAINGEEVGLSVSNISELSLENGTNQLVLQLSKLVEDGGGYVKLRSLPFVVTFEAANTDVAIKPTRIILRDNQINGYDRNPKVILDSSKSPILQSHQAILPRGKGLVRNYSKELIEFNQEYGFVAQSKVIPTISFEHSVELPQEGDSGVDTDSKPRTQEHDVILLKADYLRLSEVQKRQFLDWAKQQ